MSFYDKAQKQEELELDRVAGILEIYSMEDVLSFICKNKLSP